MVAYATPNHKRKREPPCHNPKHKDPQKVAFAFCYVILILHSIVAAMPHPNVLAGTGDPWKVKGASINA
jgi:hypothetical protein